MLSNYVNWLDIRYSDGSNLVYLSFSDVHAAVNVKENNKDIQNTELNSDILFVNLLIPWINNLTIKIPHSKYFKFIAVTYFLLLYLIS